MTETAFGLAFSTLLVERVLAASPFRERQSQAGEPLMRLTNVASGAPAGAFRLWVAEGDGRLDRLIHFRLHSDPVDTNLVFLFARPASAVPHFHAQVVQFAPDACVYNADIIPRLDPVDHPDWYRTVYGPVTKAYWKATTDRQNVCAMAPANPAIAVYLSPWGIAAGRPTDKAEFDRVSPALIEYLDQCLTLSRTLDYPAATAAALAGRDPRHMALLHSDALDPRAWKGVYRVVGDDVGQRIREAIVTPALPPAGSP